LSSGPIKIVWDDGESKLDVDNDDSKAEDAESESGSNGCEYRNGNCKNEEKGQDYGVEGAEQLHGSLQMLKMSSHIYEKNY